MEPKYKIDTTYDETAVKNINAAYLELYDRKILLIGYMILGFILSEIGARLLMIVDNEWYILFPLICFPVVLLCACFQLRPKAYVKNFHKRSCRKMKNFGTTVSYQLYPEYIEIDETRRRIGQYYNSFDALAETKQYLILFDGKSAFAISKSNLSSEKIDSLREFLEHSMGRAVKTIKY